MNVSPGDVSAVIVTKGDVDLDPILNSLPFDDIVVWSNAGRPEDLKCYGRFAALPETRNELVYFQDDDVLVPVHGFLKAWTPDDGVFANKPVSEEWRFLGVGALFNRSIVDGVFDRYLELYGEDDDFYRVCDVVFAYQRPYTWDWFGYAELEWSRYDNRMYLQRDHMAVRERARHRTYALPEPWHG